MSLRRIAPMPFPETRTPDLGLRPSLEWVKPGDLYVDDTYQRDLSRRSIQLISKMIREFAWNRMKPPIVVKSGGKMHVVDGQHTGIVAATLRIPEIPVFIVAAEALHERARSFVSHNSDRIVVSQVDVYKALVAAGDPSSLQVEQVMRQSKVRLRITNLSSIIAEGDTMAIGTIRKLVAKRPTGHSVRVLSTLVEAKHAPVSSDAIKAVDYILAADPSIQQKALIRILRVDGPEGLVAAASHAKMSKKPLWKTLVERWRRGLPNVRSAA